MPTYMTLKINVMNDPDLKTVHLLKKMPGIQVVRTPSSRHFTIPMIALFYLQWIRSEFYFESLGNF